MGHTLLGFSEKEIGRMTLRKFMKLYGHYKDNFDLETIMRKKGITYAQLPELAMKEEEWF